MKITPKQINFLESRMVDLGYSDRPSFFWDWRGKQDEDRMRKLISQMSALQASYIISSIYDDNYQEAINRWEILESVSKDLNYDRQTAN